MKYFDISLIVPVCFSFWPELDNLLLTPHCAWTCVESRQRLLDEIYENISAYEGGRTEFLSFLEIQRTLKSAQIEYAKAAADYASGLSDLGFAVGSDLATEAS